MKPAELIRSALLPVTNLSVLFSLAAFWILISLAVTARVFGVWLAVVTLPALFRYLTNLVATIGKGQDPKPPDSEFFRWIGDSWSLFPAVIVAALGWASYLLHGAAGAGWTTALVVTTGFFYPAILGVLCITRSPLQSMNPLALWNFIRRIGPLYFIAPAYLAMIVYLGPLVWKLPYLLNVLTVSLLIFSLHSVIGSIMMPHGLFDDVRIADATELSADEVAENLEKKRNSVLTHAYGFISRGNRDGGFKHIIDEIDKDPDVVRAWAWYFERMSRWEQKQHVLFFAQHYIHDLLLHGDSIPAVKVILRCRLLDEQFRPFKEDRQAAILAAETYGNKELAVVLKRS